MDKVVGVFGIIEAYAIPVVCGDGVTCDSGVVRGNEVYARMVVRGDALLVMAVL